MGTTALLGNMREKRSSLRAHPGLGRAPKGHSCQARPRRAPYHPPGHPPGVTIPTFSTFWRAGSTNRTRAKTAPFSRTPRARAHFCHGECLSPPAQSPVPPPRPPNREAVRIPQAEQGAPEAAPAHAAHRRRGEGTHSPPHSGWHRRARRPARTPRDAGRRRAARGSDTTLPPALTPPSMLDMVRDERLLECCAPRLYYDSMPRSGTHMPRRIRFKKYSKKKQKMVLAPATTKKCEFP